MKTEQSGVSAANEEMIKTMSPAKTEQSLFNKIKSEIAKKINVTKISAIDKIKIIILTGIFKLLSRLPLSMIRWIGSTVGNIAFKTSNRASRRLIDNLVKTKMCDEENAPGLAIRSAQSFGMTLVETILIAWNRSKKHNLTLFSKVEGFELVADAAKNGYPILFLTPHIGNFEICLKRTAYLLQDKKFTVLYKPDKKKWWNELMIIGRTEDNITPVPTTKKGVLTIAKALKNNEIAGVLPDSVASQSDGVWVEFFGNKVFATSLAAKLSLMPNVKTFVVASYRNEISFNADYVPFVATGTDITNTVQEIYNIIETMVLKHKEQFYWSYNRFRTPDHAKHTQAL